MKLVDVIVLAVVLGGLWFMLYRTMWKKKTLCPGCDSGCGLASRPGRCLPQQGPAVKGRTNSPDLIHVRVAAPRKK